MNELMTFVKEEKNDVILIKLDRPYELRFSNKALKEYSALTQTSMKNFDESLMDFQNQQTAAYILIKQDCQRQGLPIPTPAAVEDLLDQYVTPGRLFYSLSKAGRGSFCRRGDDGGNESQAEGCRRGMRTLPRQDGTGGRA